MSNSSKLLTSVPPNNIEAEIAVLGSMLHDKDAIFKTLELLNRDDFYKDGHGKIFQCIIDIDKRKDPVDLVTLSEELQVNDWLEETGGAVYLTTLMDGAPNSSNIEHYAQIVKDKSMARKVIVKSTELITDIFKGENDVKELLVGAQKNLLDIVLDHKEKQTADIKSVITKTIEMADEYASRGYLGLKTGFRFLDRMVGSYMPGFMWIIAAWTSVGKTSLMHEMIKRAYKNNKKNPKMLLISTEMTQVGNLLKLAGNISKIPSLRILEHHRLHETEKTRVAMAYSELSTYNLDIYDNLYKWEDIYLQTKKNKISKGLDIVFIDYIQNIQLKGTIYERMSFLGPALAEMAKELDCTVVGLSQVSNENSGGSEQFKPKGAGEIAAAADVGIELTRQRDEAKNLTDKLVVSIRKNRWGMLGQHECSFVDHFTGIEE